jgi:hypothetical protein
LLRYVNAGPSDSYMVPKLTSLNNVVQTHNASVSDSLLRRANINSKRLGVDLRDWIDSLVEKYLNL